MKYLVILLFLFSTAKAQYTIGRFTLVRNNSTTNLVNSQSGSLMRDDLRTGTVLGSGTLLVSVLNEEFFFFNANPSLSDLVQQGTSSAWNINIPSSATANKSLFIPNKNIVIGWVGTKYQIETNSTLVGVSFPLKLRLISNGQIVATIRENGNIIRDLTQSWTITNIGTTGLVQYFVN